MLEVDYRKHPVNGGIVCSGWDTRDTMYPVFYRNLYLDYTLTEVKSIIKKKYGDKYSKIKFVNSPCMSI